MINNDKQNIHRNLKTCNTRPTTNREEFVCSGKVAVIIPVEVLVVLFVINHEREKNGIVTTNRASPWSRGHI